MNTSIWLRLRWPREIPPEQMEIASRLLAAAGDKPLVVEAIGTHGQVHHQIGLSQKPAGWLTRQLRSGLPGLSVSAEDRLDYVVDRAVSLRFSTRRRSLASKDGEINRALLASLSATGQDEAVILQWLLGPVLHSEAVPSKLDGLSHESWAGELLAIPFGSQSGDGEQRRALAEKRGHAGWKAAGRIGAHAETDARRYQLIRGVLAALRLAEAPGITLLSRRTSPSSLTRPRRPWLWSVRLNARELSAVSSWPSGRTIDLPVERTPSRLIPASRLIPRRGRVVANANFPGQDRLLALGGTDSLMHLHAIGPTGTGKSTLLLNLIAQDLAAGRSVVVIESKGDLIADVCTVIPEERINDVVLIDPVDTEMAVGLNPLALNGRPPELVADQLLAVFRQLSVSWGPRLEQLLHSSLLVLAKTPGSTLVHLPLLLTNDAYRRKVTGAIHDPVALTPFWAAFEQLSGAERATTIAPVMNRLLPFLQRPQLRAILGQSQPRFGVDQVFTQRKILLVNLSKGTLGPATAALLGGLVVSQFWQATLGRSAIPAAKRHPVMVTFDEFQDYLALPTDLADALGQARGLAVGFTLAHQHLHQLDPSMRTAVLANARNRVAFQLASDDARTLSSIGGVLEPEDFSSLAVYECYVQLVAGGAVQPWASAKTLPPPMAISDPDAVRTASRANYGMPRSAVDAEIEDIVSGSRRRSGSDLGPRPRRRSPSNDEERDTGGSS